MYQIVIGLEVHLQTKTKSKIFCSCAADYFGKEPNSLTCPTCLGLPGALPTINKKAIEMCIMLSLALNCEINKFTKFDRKNYFYPDLPKGYQISQYDKPIGHDGWIEIDIEGDSRRIRIRRVHQEEDTGKSLHKKNEKTGEEYTLLDFNKSGVPLVEIVSEPDFSDVKEVIEYAKELKRIVQYLGISDANMEKGQMRFELNMSLKKEGEKKLPKYKVEVKNIGSISVLEKVIRFEYKRQSVLLDKGETPIQETRGLKDMSGETLSQRIKEGEADYRYFPEPDLPPIVIEDKWIDEIKSQIPELPWQKRDRFLKEYKLDREISRVLTSSKLRSDFFEKAVKGQKSQVITSVAHLIVGDLASLMKKNQIKFKDLKIKGEYLVEISNLISNRKISGTIAKQVLEESFKTGENPVLIIKERNLEQISNESELEEIVRDTIKANPKAAEDYKNGKQNAIGFLLGQVMRETKGKANPKVAVSILKNNLDKEY